jgi:hypothetical protein
VTKTSVDDFVAEVVELNDGIGKGKSMGRA